MNVPTERPSFADDKFDELLRQLAADSAQPEQEENWPGSQLQKLATTNVLGWVIPAKFGGSELSSADLTWGYTALAEACLTTTFVLTQRNGACQRIAGSPNESVREELLPALCRGEIFATVGISHLSTSRQYCSQPAVTVRETDDQYILDGEIPWVTGGPEADYIVTGGTCADGRQILVAVSTKLPGVEIKPIAKMLSLNGSLTGPAELHEVAIDKRYLLAGPIENVMKVGTGGGTGSLTTSALAVGTARAAIARLGAELEHRPELAEIHAPLQKAADQLLEQMIAATQPSQQGGHPIPSVETIRHRANSLVLRATQADLAAAKGAGFLQGHPAERGVREAMFFLVWSCPQPVLTANMREFACILG